MNVVTEDYADHYGAEPGTVVLGRPPGGPWSVRIEGYDTPPIECRTRDEINAAIDTIRKGPTS